MTTTTKRRPWTAEQLKQLRAHSRKRTRVLTLSRMTRRTQGALRQKALELGIPLGHRRKARGRRP